MINNIEEGEDKWTELSKWHFQERPFIPNMNVLRGWYLIKKKQQQQIKSSAEIVYVSKNAQMLYSIANCKYNSVCYYQFYQHINTGRKKPLKKTYLTICLKPKDTFSILFFLHFNARSYRYGFFFCSILTHFIVRWILYSIILYSKFCFLYSCFFFCKIRICNLSVM